MKLSARGLDLLKRFEGYRSRVYNDMGGKPTVGYGHLVQPGEAFTLALTEPEAEELLCKDIAGAEAAVRDYVSAPLTQGQFDALVCFVFNTGSRAFAASTLRKIVNDSRHFDVPAELTKWHFVKKEPSKGLMRRRCAEAELYFT